MKVKCCVCGNTLENDSAGYIVDKNNIWFHCPADELGDPDTCDYQAEASEEYLTDIRAYNAKEYCP